MSYIEIKNLNFTYPEEKEQALDNVNLSIRKGEILLIAGKSGSGKSTLAKAIVGTVPHFYGGTISGQILIEGKSIIEMSHTERAQKITMVFQDPEKQLMLNKVHREVAFGLENVGVAEQSIKRRVYEALQFIGILELAEREITSLSGGEKQKVAVASALAYLPQCIVLDEPTSQLDPSSAEEIIALVKKINEELGITIIIIEQRVNRCFDTADEIVIMEKGKASFFKDRESFFKNCSPAEAMFMPDYLRFFKEINLEPMPKNFKAARSIFLSSNAAFEGETAANCVRKDEEMVVIKNMSSSYGTKEVLKNVNFTVNSGDFISIMGANGAGKSTFLKALIGLKEYRGSIMLCGEEIHKKDIRSIAKTIGYVSQNPNDYLSKDTVFEEVKFTLDNYEIEDDERVVSILKELDIYELKDKNPRDLSGGQKQRVAIASILVLQPKLILLDEPTRGLESHLKQKLGELLKELNHNGTTIILITHDTDFASAFCSRYVLMFNGKIAADGGREETLGEGIFYTTIINKLIREKNKSIFTLNEAVRMCRI